MVARSAKTSKTWPYALTLGHSYQNRGDHFDLRKGEWVMREEGRWGGEKAKVKKFTDYRSWSLKANESLS